MHLPTVSHPSPPKTDANASGYALAEAHKPILRFDVCEPALPLAIGYTIASEPQSSPSSKFTLTPPHGGKVIEYAIWYDWDIQHLYDLEHVWVHLDRAGAVVRVEASLHGFRVSMDSGDGLPEMRSGRPVLFAEPGKHAHWAFEQPMQLAKDQILRSCGPQAGATGVHTGNRFAQAGAIAPRPIDHRLATLAMKRAAFVPQFDFSRTGETAELVPWAGLEEWIPGRVNALMEALPGQVPHLAAVFLDCGDTLIDEATEIKVEGSELVLEAEEIPHAMDAVRELHRLGYPLALVADGPRGTFENLLKPRGIWDLMQAHVISGDIGELKPSPKMFAAAMDALQIGEADRSRVVMVGNNLARDIRGANEFGLKSLHVAWSKRRSHVPDHDSEHPDARIDRLDQLVSAIINAEMSIAVGASRSDRDD